MLNKNKITSVVVIICYFILCISYAIRGEFNIFGNKMQFAHHFMQFVVSITYFTIAYTYLIDNDYDEDEYKHFYENPHVIHAFIIYTIGLILLTIFYIVFKRQNALVS